MQHALPICIRKSVISRAIFPFTLLYLTNISLTHSQEMSKELLGHGVSVIKLVVTAAQTSPPPSGNRYADLAEKLRYDVLTARAVGKVASTNANVIATALTTYAITTPEPITKIVAAAGAMAAKEQGEFISNTIVESSTKQSLKLLKKFLDDQQVQPAQLAGMNANEFMAFSRTLRSGNQTLTEALADVPGATATIDAAAQDFLQNKDAAMFLKIDKVDESIDQLKHGMKVNADALKKLQSMAQATNKSLLQLKDETIALREDVKDLTSAVAGNTNSIRSLIEVSSMSWSPEQKLAAVEAGLFKDLTASDKEKLVKSLQTEIRRDNLVGELSLRGRQLGQLANIASGLGVDQKVVDAMVRGQQLANTAVAFVSGDYLSAASSVVSMFGGQRDAAGERHAEMMRYLADQFRQVNVKLDEIKKLQEETLQQTVALRQEVFELRKAMDAAFRRIEDQIYLSQELSRKLIRREWDPCDYLLTQLNGYPSVQSVAALKRLLSIQVQDNLVSCYSGTNNSFSLWVNPDQWPASIIDSAVFNTNIPTTDAAALAGAKAYADNARQIFGDTRDFVLVAMPRDHLIEELSRFALPALYAQQSEQIEKDRSTILPPDDCSPLFVDLPALLRIACYAYDPVSRRPDPRRIPNILSPTLIGPMAPATIDVAILMSDMADLFLKRGPGAATNYSFADSGDIDELMQGKVSRAASQRLRQGKGVELLGLIDTFSLQWLIQQSLIFGDHTAQLVIKEIYDEDEGALIFKDPGPDYPDQQRRQRILAAHKAMRTNAILARNVVLLGLRKALRQRRGDIPTVAYRLGWSGLQDPSACMGTGASANWINDLLKPIKGKAPYAGWNFRRIATSIEAAPNGVYSGCQQDDSGDGRAGVGPSVLFDGFHVRIPNFQQLDAGNLEHPASLREALIYRNKTTQALIARNLVNIAGDSVSTTLLFDLYGTSK